MKGSIVNKMLPKCVDKDIRLIPILEFGGQLIITFSHNILRTEQKCCCFVDDALKCIFVLENIWILIKIGILLHWNA